MSFPKPQANVVTIGVASDSPSNRYHVTSPELNCVLNSNDWFIDSEANVHVCANKKVIFFISKIKHTIVSIGSRSMAHVLGDNYNYLII